MSGVATWDGGVRGDGVAALEVDGDLGADRGEVSHGGDIRVRGSITAGARVSAEGGIVVAGSIESASVRAMGDVEVAVDIVGRNKGTCACGGSVRFRSANAAVIEAGGSVTARVEIANSRVIVAGALRGETLHLYGGHATVNGGIICQTLGSPGEIVTVVEVGIDERLRRLGERHAAGIEGNLRRAHRIRSQIEPLLANQKALTASQKESATELLYTAGELERETASLVGELRETMVSSLGASVRSIEAHGMIYPGVLVRFSSVEVGIQKPIKGPVKMVAEGVGRGTRVVLTDLETKRTEMLAFVPWVDGAMSQLVRAVAPGSAREKKSAA